MPDIIITPNSGIIDFFPVSTRVGRIEGSGNTINIINPSGFVAVSGSGLSINTSSPNATFHAYSATSGATLLNIEGTNGSLFSVIDNLSGTLMSVNNNAGLPVFEVFSDDRVVAGRFGRNDFIMTSGGNVGIGHSLPTTKLAVSGAVSITGLLTTTSGNFISSLQLNGTNVSISGHSHTSSDISNFNSSVSGVVSGIYAPLSSPALIGTPTVPTAASGTNTTQIASTSFVRTEISNLVSSAPATLDTLNELATALGNDASFSTTVTTNLAGKANLSGATFTGSVSGPSGNFTSLKVNSVDVSANGHTHTSSNITDFNSSVSGLLPTIANSGDNRVLTSTGGSVGVNAESNLTFNGSLLSVTGSGVFSSGIIASNISVTGNMISATNTNGNLIIKPNGNGALQADNAGNSRGIFSVDLQRSRVSVSGVAHGNYSVIGGGRDNRSAGSDSTVGGGQNNSAGGSKSTVGGGVSNSAGGYHSTVGGGKNNSAGGNKSTVGGGGDNSASSYCSTVGGGLYNSAGGTHSTIGGGSYNSAGGTHSTIGGGYLNTTDGAYSTVPGGIQAKATRHGEISHSAGEFNYNGDAQHTILIARRTTIAATPAILFLNGSTDRLTIPAETTWIFTIKLSAYNDTDNLGAGWNIRGAIRTNAANSTAILGSNIIESWVEGAMSGCVATVTADTTNQALQINVTGLATKSIRWVAVVDISQVSYGVP